jgi:hypothetical protein
MPLLIPVYTETEALEAAPRFYYAGLFAVTVQSQPTDTLFAAAQVTREGEEAVLNASADVEAGDSIPVIIDLTNTDLR